jgi:uncharacterized protein YdgA (DUF945 family)
MKKIVIVVLVMFLVLVAAPWGIGRLAEKRVNDGLDKLVQEAPYLTIVERKWTGGWFRSEQEVTFEVFGAWVDAMNPKNVLAAEAADEAAEDEAVEAEAAPEAETEAQELARRKQSAVPGTEAAVDAWTAEEPKADETPAEPAAEPEPAKPIRFTVRNEILHGPMLWPASFGLARVNTKLVLSDDIRKQLMEFFGTDEPMRISSRVGFFGGGSTRFYGDGRTIEAKGDGGVLVYDDFEIEIGYSGDFDEVDAEGSWSKLEFSNKNSGERLVLSDMSLEGDSERIVGDLYDSDFRLEVDQMLFAGMDRMETTVDDIVYQVETSEDDGFFDMSARVGTGKVRNPAFEELQLDLKEVHYDFTVRHLHTETLNKLITSWKAAYAKPVATVADVDALVMAPMKEHGLALLRHDPEFSVDRIGVVTAEGEGVLKGVLRLPGVTEEDIAAGAMGLVDKLVADFNIEVAQKLLEKIPNGATGAGVAVDQGFARREGEKLVSHIEFSKGELKVNGKPVPIPGFGAPPPAQDGYPAEEAPPEE